MMLGSQAHLNAHSGFQTYILPNFSATHFPNHITSFHHSHQLLSFAEVNREGSVYLIL